MIRSLRIGVTGLKSHQTRMDVVGNNIANVNTIGFKRSRTTFNELLGQQLLGSSRTAGGRSINASFIGFGAGTGSIDQTWSQGALESTGILTDLALTGDGFFLARNSQGRQLLTRAGNFYMADDGAFVTRQNYNVQGYSIDTDGQVDTRQLQDVKIDWTAQSAPQYTENVEASGNLSAAAAVGDEVTLSTFLYDEQGSTHSALITLTKTGANAWDYAISYNGTATTPPFATVNGALTFDVNGQLTAPPPTIALTWDAAYVTGSPAVNIDLSSLTQYASSSTAVVRDQDGRGPGQLAGYAIDPTGILSLNFTNGESMALYQLALGSVNNPNALENLGNNFYGVTNDSGELLVGRSGNEFSSEIATGQLEMSNVDLATEFTDMIVAQRGYQASARVITTSDELLQEVVSLKR
jgi:flagellar hook protein FlgE